MLDNENWSKSLRKMKSRLCKKCAVENAHLWTKSNPERVKAAYIRYTRKQGHRPYNENRECASFLGVHVAERVLSHVFKDVERMPIHHSGYDFVCNKGKCIDVKSSCLHRDRKSQTWQFNINHNTIADYFLCLAFDDRERLNPIHIWILPGDLVNSLKMATIRPSTVQKWAGYELDVSRVSACCDLLKVGIPITGEMI